MCRYEASTQGYDATAKRREILHAESRFIVARDPSQSSALAGYVVCRFELEDGADGRKIAVVYWCASAPFALAHPAATSSNSRKGIEEKASHACSCAVCAPSARRTRWTRSCSLSSSVRALAMPPC